LLPILLMTAKTNRESALARAARSLQENVSRSGPVAGASYTLIGAIILLGGLGYGLDRWLGTAPWLLVTGLTLGIVVGFYELAKTVWPR
jgi:F0F1-type ATP synthase assembly protein I